MEHTHAQEDLENLKTQWVQKLKDVISGISEKVCVCRGWASARSSRDRWSKEVGVLSFWSGRPRFSRAVCQMR